MKPMETIERLTSSGPRWPGLDGDKPATDHISEQLRQMGREARVEEIRVRPAYHVTLALLAAIAIAGNVLSSTSSPPLGVALLLIASAAMYGDLTSRFSPFRLLTARRQTRNVTSPGGKPDAKHRVIITAHHDAGYGGLLYARPRRGRRRRPSFLARLAGPLDILFWATIASLVAAVVRLVTDTDATALTIVQFALTVVLAAYVALLIDSALAGVVPGASSNASGVAALLDVARRLEGMPPLHLDVWAVFPAAKEGFGLGMRRWMKEHADDIDPRYTYFINIDSVGNGDVHHVTGEGFGLMYRHDRRLVRLCESIGSSPYVWRLGTDGVIPLMRGYPTITLCSLERGRIPHFHAKSDTPANVHPEAVDQAVDFVEKLVRRMDAALAPDPADSKPLAAQAPT
jgi:Peptidase family M28